MKDQRQGVGGPGTAMLIGVIGGVVALWNIYRETLLPFKTSYLQTADRREKLIAEGQAVSGNGGSFSNP
ncbi:hypothetical protein CCH79_00007115 [Gambusia affinis]|uniref:Uncharacterized protein n=1 Tax=Gambusia affinis TaxID=33528 RepID=A0A315VCZ0_GAMAF|nr:hypothetical protein CCH79_00007115 [Gambusia affinis]